MWAQAQPLPGLCHWAPHLSVVLVTILFAQAAVINPEGKKNETNSVSKQPQVGYPGVNSVAPGPLAQCNNYYADIVFVVDSSAVYMNDDYWRKVKEFLSEVSIVLGAGQDDRIRLGMVVYGENYSQVFSLDNFTVSSQIAQAILNAQRKSNETVANITTVLHGLHAELFTYDNGARMFLPHQAVIFTTPMLQNKATEEDIIEEIAMVHDAGIETYSIAVEAEADFEELAKLLASPPRKAGKNYWYLKHYGNLDMSLVTDLAAELCTFNRDTSITFSRSYAPANGRDQQYDNGQNFDQDQFRAAQPNDQEDYDRRQQKNFGGPPVIRNDNFDDRRDNRDDHDNRDDRQRFEEPQEERERPPPPPPPRQERPIARRPIRRGPGPRGPGPRIGASYQGPPPRKDGGGNGPPPPGGQGPGGGKAEGVGRVAGIGASGGRAPQSDSGYVPIGGFAFGGHDGFRGPNRSPQGIPLRGLNGYGYGGHDGFVGYGPHAFSYGSAGVRGPVFGPRAPVYRSPKTRNPAPPRPREDSGEDRERRPPPEDSREKFDNNHRNQESFRPPPNQEQFRPPPPRNDQDDFRSAPPRENNFRPPPPQNNFRPPPRDNFRDDNHRDQFRPPPNNHGNFDDDSQENFRRPPPNQDFNRPPPQQNFHNERPPPNQFQNNRPPPPLPRERFQDNRQGRPPPNNFHRNDNNRARDESPQDDDQPEYPRHQENFEPPPPPVSYVRPILGFNSPVNPHNTLNRHPNDANYNHGHSQQGSYNRAPQSYAKDQYDDGAGDGQIQGHPPQRFQQPQNHQRQAREPGPQYTQAGQIGQGVQVQGRQSYDNNRKDEFHKGRDYGRVYQNGGKYDNSYEDRGAKYPEQKLRYSNKHQEGNYENFRGYNKYYGTEDHVRERGEDVGRFIAGAGEYNNNDNHRRDDGRNYDVPSKDYRPESEAPSYKSSETAQKPKTDADNQREGTESEGTKEFFGKALNPYNEGYKKAPEEETKEKQYEPREYRPTIEHVGQPLTFYDPRREVYPVPPPPGAIPFGGQRFPEGRRPEGNIYGGRQGEGPRETVYGSREGGINGPREPPIYGSREVGGNRPNEQNIYGSQEVERERGEGQQRRPNIGSEPRIPFNPYGQGQPGGRRPFYPYPPHSGDPRRPVEIYRYVPIIGRPPASYETLRNQPSYYGNPEIQGRLESPGIPIFKIQDGRRRQEGYKDLHVDHIAKDIHGGGEVVSREDIAEQKKDQVTEPPKAKTEQHDQPRAARISAAVPPSDDKSAEGITGSTVTIAAIAGVLGTIFLCAVIALTTRSVQNRKKRREAEKMAALSRHNRFIPPNHLPFNSMSSKFSSADLDIDDDTISTISSTYSVVSGHSKNA